MNKLKKHNIKHKHKHKHKKHIKEYDKEDMDIVDIIDNDSDDLSDIDRGNNDNDAELACYIPKIIMQTWKNNEVPEHWKESPVSIKKHMPDWKYVLMTDEDNDKFVKEHFIWFYDTFVNFEYGIQRADAIRYMWLYINGGVYMDLDMLLQKPLDPLFTTDNELYLVCSNNAYGIITNSFMASKPGCRMWIDMLKYMMKGVSKWCIGRHLKVYWSTGPLALDYVVKKVSDVVYAGLPSHLIAPCSVCEIGRYVNKDAYIIPLEGMSWIGYDTMFYNYWLCHWKETVLSIILVIIATVLIILAYYFELEQNKRKTFICSVIAIAVLLIAYIVHKFNK